MSERRMNTRGPAARPTVQGRVPRRRGGAAGAGAAHRYAAVKWALLAALVVYTVLVVRMNGARDVDFSVIRGAMAAAPGVADLKVLDENSFQERLDASPAGCEAWLMVGSDEIMDVSELMIARGSEATLSTLEDAVRRRLDSQLAVFRSYGVNQKELLEGASVLRRGNYLFYAVGEYANRWEDAFLACIR